MILILCGKSGSGKDSIQRMLLKECDFLPIVSTTTRPMRDGETDGIDYYFRTRDEFMKMIDDDRLVEYRSYNTLVGGQPDTWYYGAEKIDLDSKKNYVVILDLDGAKSFIDYYGAEKCCVCYVEAPEKIRRKRAEKRGSFDATEWERRVHSDDMDFDMDVITDIANMTVYNDGSLRDCVSKILTTFTLVKILLYASTDF